GRNPMRPGGILLQPLEEGTDPRVLPVDEHPRVDTLLEVLAGAVPVAIAEAPQADREVRLAALGPAVACGLEQGGGLELAGQGLPVLLKPALMPRRQLVRPDRPAGPGRLGPLPEKQQDQ